MAVTPVEHADKTETVEERFHRLEALWTAETGHHSSTTKIINHPAFQEIISMGKAVVPFMLREMEEGPSLWVWALPKIVGVDPTPESERGNMASLSKAWLKWAKEHGYQW